jgi:hypothetical protein
MSKMARVLNHNTKSPRTQEVKPLQKAPGHNGRTYCIARCEVCLFDMVQSKLRSETSALGSPAWVKRTAEQSRLAQFAADFDAGRIVWQGDTPVNTRTGKAVFA